MEVMEKKADSLYPGCGDKFFALAGDYGVKRLWFLPRCCFEPFVMEEKCCFIKEVFIWAGLLKLFITVYHFCIM